MCGGTRLSVLLVRIVHGLSPRVRGNPPSNEPVTITRRSIPACAGEPPSWLTSFRNDTVYPRVCGGTRQHSRIVCPRVGLSPRVRGNLPALPRPDLSAGSIPACAGEPYWSATMEERWAVYPRVCGGTSPEPPDDDLIIGLSPRVRGNLDSWARRLGMPGSIPACAGEPILTISNALQDEVYPRVCGGTPRSDSVVSPAVGLSPRVRGNREPFFGYGGVLRSIPACAGEPLFFSLSGSPPWVYPRVCGGTSPEQLREGWANGLSPRVRGNPPGRGESCSR